MSSNPPTIEFPDEKIKRNYHFVKNYLISLVDLGLSYLREEYVRKNSETSFQEFTAQNYFDYVLKDYVKRKVKGQIRVVLHTAVSCVPYFQGNTIEPDFLDQVVARTHKNYAEFDMSLLHSSISHPSRKELEIISNLTYRVCLIQATRILSCQRDDILDYPSLTRCVYPAVELAQESLNAILSMIDQMIDCFERSLEIIQIPFFKPTWNIRDFYYMRKLYEYALKVAQEQLDKIYGG